MKVFNLPDLGEGLPDAEIREWFVKEGDEVKVDQPVVSMETAKAVVEVPSPESGIIEKLFGKPGDIIKTGQPLVAFKESTKKDTGTVVGNLLESEDITEDNFTIGGSKSQSKNKIKATIFVKNFAKKLGVDLNSVQGTGDHGVITKEDVEKAAKQEFSGVKDKEGFTPLHGTRRAMLFSMKKSHEEVVPVSIYDDADVHHWGHNADITVRLIRAIQEAAKREPALNAWFDTETSSIKLFDNVQLGLAMDSSEGLFVPVIHDSNDKSDEELRSIITKYKQEVHDRTLSPENFHGATFTLSNFGKFSGKYASPIIVPPQVGILAVGRMYQAVVPHNDSYACHKLIPLSLTFDHRAVTGGEATRFLGAVIKSLQE